MCPRTAASPEKPAREPKGWLVLVLVVERPLEHVENELGERAFLALPLAAGVVAAVHNGVRDAEVAHAEPPGELFFLVFEEHQETFVVDLELLGVPEVVVRLHEVFAAAEGQVELAEDQRN